MKIKNSINDIIAQKKEWKAHMDRVSALPEEYRIVYKEMQNYLFKVGLSCHSKWTFILSDIVDLFETGAKAGKGVLEVTGEDVAQFCDDLMENSPNPDDIVRSKMPAADKQIQKAMEKAANSVLKKTGME